MSQLIQHYQTSFVIKNDEQDAQNKLFQAQYVIGEWIKKKESRRFREMGRDKTCSFFLMGGEFRHRARFQSKCSWCKTNYANTDDSLGWAIEYTHRDSNIWDVYWVTEIGLRAFFGTKDLVVSVKVSYKLSTEFAFRGEPYKPEVSIPWCVEAMLMSFEGSKFYSGGVDVTGGIGSAIHIDNLELAQKLQEYIASSSRKLAVVLLCGTTDVVKKEADFYSKHLFAKALVFTLPCNEMRQYLKVNISLNECVFIPSFRVYDREVEKALHYVVTDPARMDERRKVLLKSWLGVHPVNEDGAITSQEGITYMIRQQMLRRLEEKMKEYIPRQNYEAVKRELHDVSGLFELSEQENKELRDEKEVLTGETRKLKDDKEMLLLEKDELQDQHRAELYTLNLQHQGEMRKRVEARELPRDLPLTVSSLKKWSQMFGHLVIVDKAWNGMESRSREEFVKTAWDMLWCLENVVFPFYDGEETGEPGRIIEQKAGYKFSSHESHTTESRDEWARERNAVYGKKTIPCFKHLKKNDGAANAMRVHFEYLPDVSKIIVAHIGEHLTTKGTSHT